MIGSPVKLNVNAAAKDIKEVQSFTLTGSLIEKLNSEMQANNVSRSELVEYALRTLFKIDTNNCRNVLNVIYKQ